MSGIVTGYAYTRCPGCATVFRVTPPQLALREGQVRCGHCRAVFDANGHRIALEAQGSDDVDIPDELAAGRPTVTLRSADALHPVDGAAAMEDAPGRTMQDGPVAAAGTPAGVPETPDDATAPPTDAAETPADVVSAGEPSKDLAREPPN